MTAVLAPPDVDRLAMGRRQGRRVVGRIAGAVAAIALVCGAVVATLALLIGIPPWVGLVVAVLVGAGLWWGTVLPRLRGADERVLTLVGPARPADPRAEARLLNLVEGLSPAAGLPRPQCYVIDDASMNSLVFGRDPRVGWVIVTAGLLSRLSRMELEGVVAHALVQLRDGTTIAPTLELSLGPAGRLGRPLAPPPPATLIDTDAVSMTRYPPGLSAALRAIGVAGAGAPAAPPGASPELAGLWLAAPGDRHSLAARIESLDEM